jgi:hypothetical protein
MNITPPPRRARASTNNQSTTKDCTQKCFIGFQDCNKNYNCISCKTSKEYWKTIQEKTKQPINTTPKKILTSI